MVMLNALSLPSLVASALSAASPAPPMQIDLQGLLTSVSGLPATDGTYGLTIAFYADETGGQPLYTDFEPAVVVVDGRFSLRAGGAVPLDVAPFAEAAARWVGVAVGGEPELPRQALGVVPYALRSESAADLACTGCVSTAELSAEVLAPYVLLADLSAVALSGSYTDLLDRPVLVAPSQACPPGTVVSGLDAMGAVVCAADKDTTYTGATFATSSQGCSSGQVVTGLNATGAVTCATDKVTTYSGADFATSNQGCTGGQVVTGVSPSGAITCASDKDTTYSGATFALSGQDCALGSVVTGITSAGALTCSPFGVAPIGSIVAWHKTLSGTPSLPSGWLECNGQIVGDAASPYKGAAVPALNGNNQFLRGAATSGATGGSETHNHSFVQTTQDYAPDASRYTDGSIIQPASSLPPFMNVVWIIRVR